MVSEKNEHCSSLICSTASQCDLLEGHVTPRSSGSRTCSSLSSPARLESPREKNKVYRVFVPHSHLDVHVGHRVRVLLPSGRISTGTIQFLGFLSSLQDFRIGVELESPEYGQHDGVFEGQRYFHCKPGHGVFVSFNKLLMAWE
ncbi:CAP-Gly domain-containing linker protein 4-like [Polypterus senegalus]|uniref:CAP-Gly domain-containing linker protein 4-like n=1 Tax=Polypterus senegalus TaxID=55291 RepID=UPI001963363F|nr:CAP-Gly domain-containing linker protein 4-like [Polypterus senegalus]